MKKILISLCLLLLVGCSTNNNAEVVEDTNEDVTNMISPLVTYSSLDEINEISHGHLAKPKSSKVEKERYTIITIDDNTIAEYAFTIKDADYFLRFSDQILDSDITGIYHDSELLGFEGIDDPEATIEIDSGMLSRWFTVDGQYTLFARGDFTEKSFNKIVKELHKLSAQQ